MNIKKTSLRTKQTVERFLEVVRIRLQRGNRLRTAEAHGRQLLDRLDIIFHRRGRRPNSGRFGQGRQVLREL